MPVLCILRTLCREEGNGLDGMVTQTFWPRPLSHVIHREGALDAGMQHSAEKHRVTTRLYDIFFPPDEF